MSTITSLHITSSPCTTDHFVPLELLACGHSQPVGERSRGCLAAEPFSLPHLALSHRKPSCVGGILKISSAERHQEPLQVWPEQFAQDDRCIVQAELKFWSEGNLSVSLSFPVSSFSRSFTLLENHPKN